MDDNLKEMINDANKYPIEKEIELLQLAIHDNEYSRKSFNENIKKIYEGRIGFRYVKYFWKKNLIRASLLRGVVLTKKGKKYLDKCVKILDTIKS